MRPDATPTDRLLALSRAAKSVLDHYIRLHKTIVEGMQAYYDSIGSDMPESEQALIILRMGHSVSAQINQNALSLDPGDISQITETFAYYRTVAAKNRRNAEYMRRQRAKLDTRYGSRERERPAVYGPEPTAPYASPARSARRQKQADEVWETDGETQVPDNAPETASESPEVLASLHLAPATEIAPDVLAALDLGSVADADQRAELAAQIESDKQVLEELRREGRC